MNSTFGEIKKDILKVAVASLEEPWGYGESLKGVLVVVPPLEKNSILPSLKSGRTRTNDKMG